MISDHELQHHFGWKFCQNKQPEIGCWVECPVDYNSGKPCLCKMYADEATAYIRRVCRGKGEN